MVGDTYELLHDIKFGRIASKGQQFKCKKQNDKVVLIDDKGNYFCDEGSIMCKVNCKKVTE